MEQRACMVPYVGQVGNGNAISNIQQASLELRLAEMEFFRAAVKNIKGQHRKKILRTLLIAFGIALIMGVIYCQFIHCPFLRSI